VILLLVKKGRIPQAYLHRYVGAGVVTRRREDLVDCSVGYEA